MPLEQQPEEIKMNQNKYMDTEENEDTLEENGGQMDGYFMNVKSKENMHYIWRYTKTNQKFISVYCGLKCRS